MTTKNVYEGQVMQKTLGDTLRPGGYTLTKKAVDFCNLTAKDTVLDLGCARGATIDYLYKEHHIIAVGVDPSTRLLRAAKKNCPFTDFVIGQGEALPFPADRFSCVFAECTLSLMEDLPAVVSEVNRVLKRDGWFVVTDVYARNPDALCDLQTSNVKSCMRGLHDIEKLQALLIRTGFEVAYFEDFSPLLKELMVKIIFAYGSMEVFWDKAADAKTCSLGTTFQTQLTACRPGYFILIGRKKVDAWKI